MELIKKFSWPATFTRGGRFPETVQCGDIRTRGVVTFADGTQLFIGCEYNPRNPYTLLVYNSISEIMRIEDVTKDDREVGIGRSYRVSSANQVIGHIKTIGTRLFRGGFAGTLMLYYGDRTEYIRKVYHGKIKSLGLNVYANYWQTKMTAEKIADSDIDELLLLAVCTELWFGAYAEN